MAERARLGPSAGLIGAVPEGRTGVDPSLLLWYEDENSNFITTLSWTAVRSRVVRQILLRCNGVALKEEL